MSRDTTMKVERSSKPLGPLGSMRTSSGETEGKRSNGELWERAKQAGSAEGEIAERRKAKQESRAQMKRQGIDGHHSVRSATIGRRWRWTS